MRTVGTYFEQVPKAVVEKILARQVQALESELVGATAVNKRAAGKAASKTAGGAKSRKPDIE
jgi:hypothetical protein